MNEREWYMAIPQARPVFLVRWEDEESGWHQLQVIAQDKEEAVATVANAVGQHYQLRAYQL